MARITKNQLVLLILALFVMYLPSRFEILGIFSFRLFILIAFFLAALFGTKIKINVLLKDRFFWIYIICFCVRYILANEIISMIGFLVDTVVLSFLLCSCFKKKSDIDYFIITFIRVLAVYCGFCIIETITGFNIWSALGLVSGNSFIRFGLYRCYGSFTTSINNGVFLCLCFPLIFYGRDHIKRAQGLTKVTNILVWISLVCTLSRGPLLMAALFHIILLWRNGIFRFIKKHFWAVGLAIIAFVIMCFVEPTKSIIHSFFDMFAAIFSDEAASRISSSFGANANGIGHRILLFSWVWDKLSQNNIWIGVGPNTAFDYSFVASQGSTHLKQSIENEYLATLYRYGIVGMVIQIIFFVSCLRKVYDRVAIERKTYNCSVEETTQFKIGTCLLCYFVTLLTVGTADEYKMVFILLAISVSLINCLDHSGAAMNSI